METLHVGHFVFFICHGMKSRTTRTRNGIRGNESWIENDDIFQNGRYHFDSFSLTTIGKENKGKETVDALPSFVIGLNET